jgi:hypothetical protein
LATEKIRLRCHLNVAFYFTIYRQIDNLIDDINEHLGSVSILNNWRDVSLVPIDTQFSTFMFWNFVFLWLGVCSLVYCLLIESTSIAYYLIGVVLSSLMICRSAYGINFVKKKNYRIADNFLLMNVIIFVAKILFSGIYMWVDISTHVLASYYAALIAFFVYFRYIGIYLIQRLKMRII